METGAASFTAPAALRGPVIGDIGNWVEWTPIHHVSRQGQVLKLKQLIESGVCVNLVTLDSITPLHEACIQGHIQCVKLLLAAGAQGGFTQCCCDGRWSAEQIIKFMDGFRLGAFEQELLQFMSAPHVTLNSNIYS